MYNQDYLIKQLRQMGICSADTITIHCSLKAIGEVEGRAEGLINVLRRTVCDGLLLIPSHTYQNIREVPVYDVRETKPCIGTLPCIAVEMANRAADSGEKGCIRSLNPSHSVVAFGKNAEEYVANDALAESALPINGSYGKLVDVKGKILLAGVGVKNNTFMHMICEYAGADDEQPLTDVEVIDYNRNRKMRHNRHAYGGSGSFAKFDKCLKKAGAFSYGKLGDAEVILCDAKKCFDAVLKELKFGSIHRF